ALTSLPPIAWGQTRYVTTVDEVIRSEQFVVPPDPVAAAVLAPRHLNVSLTEASPDKRFFIHQVGDGPVGMETFSKPFDELGSLFIDFQANRNRSFTIRSFTASEIDGTDGSRVAVQLPQGARVSDATWSPDWARIAFFLHTADAPHFWVVERATG